MGLKSFSSDSSILTADQAKPKRGARIQGLPSDPFFFGALVIIE